MDPVLGCQQYSQSNLVRHHRARVVTSSTSFVGAGSPWSTTGYVGTSVGAVGSGSASLWESLGTIVVACSNSHRGNHWKLELWLLQFPQSELEHWELEL